MQDRHDSHGGCGRCEVRDIYCTFLQCYFGSHDGPTKEIKGVIEQWSRVGFCWPLHQAEKYLKEFLLNAALEGLQRLSVDSSKNRLLLLSLTNSLTCFVSSRNQHLFLFIVVAVSFNQASEDFAEVVVIQRATQFCSLTQKHLWIKEKMPKFKKKELLGSSKPLRAFELLNGS